MKFWKLMFIANLILLISPGALAFDICDPMKTGAVDFRKYEDGVQVNELRFSSPNLNERIGFSYPNPDIVVYPSYSQIECQGQIVNPILQVDLRGESAKSLIRALLEAHLRLSKTAQKSNLRIMEFGRIFISAKGVSCHIHDPQTKLKDPSIYFECRFEVLDDRVTTLPGLFAIPTPRMGAGNARAILDRL